MAIEARFAVWGALANGDPNNAQAADVGRRLQQLFNDGVTTIAIDDDNFGDPAYGFKKHFAATVDHNGRLSHYACEEGQTIKSMSASDRGRRCLAGDPAARQAHRDTRPGRFFTGRLDERQRASPQKPGQKPA